MDRIVDELARGRESYARRAWMDAYTSLSLADQAEALGAGDLELLATSAYMLGRDDEYVSALERAHHVVLDAGDPLRAARYAFWMAASLILRGEMGRATGWLGRGRLVSVMAGLLPPSELFGPQPANGSPTPEDSHGVAR